MSPRTLESLCQELVDQGLLKLPKYFRMQDFLGMTVNCFVCSWFLANVLMILAECELHSDGAHLRQCTERFGMSTFQENI